MRPLITILFSIIVLITYGQEQTVNVRSIETYFAELGEVCFSFDLENDDMMRKLTAIISIDNVVGKTVMAYANQEEFNQFLEFRIPYKIVPHSSDIPVEITMLGKDNLKDITDWNFYPTYDAYISMMYQFAIDYPDLCNVFSIGNSVQGRQLVMAKISKNVNTREPEPQFLYTGTMHGDELAGYNFLLRMIDYLLTNYSVDPDVTYLLDNVEIWINPLSNPDGTYKGGNNTVNSSVRYNANNVDLNRNYPDPEDGPHPDGKAWQPETIAFMQLAEQNNFVMAGNTHGGEEVINYPWIHGRTSQPITTGGYLYVVNMWIPFIYIPLLIT
jgi:murein tripeptide amidase MpaA